MLRGSEKGQMNAGVFAGEGQLELSAHFALRQAQRRVSDEAVALALRYGKRFHEGHDCVYFLGRRQMPQDVPPKLAEKANGTVIVVGANRTLITTYRNPNFVRTLKRRR
jgi:hypothetical protein